MPEEYLIPDDGLVTKEDIDSFISAYGPELGMSKAYSLYLKLKEGESDGNVMEKGRSSKNLTKTLSNIPVSESVSDAAKRAEEYHSENNQPSEEREATQSVYHQVHLSYFKPSKYLTREEKAQILDECEGNYQSAKIRVDNLTTERALQREKESKVGKLEEFLKGEGIISSTEEIMGVLEACGYDLRFAKRTGVKKFSTAREEIADRDISIATEKSDIQIRGNLSTAEARREYQRRYYQLHKEKAKEYQRQYNLKHKKKAKGGRGKSSFTCQREVVRTTFNAADIMHAPPEKAIKILEKIFSGERLFTN